MSQVQQHELGKIEADENVMLEIQTMLIFVRELPLELQRSLWDTKMYP